MENKWIKTGFIGLLLLTMFASCYDDKSTLPTVEYPDVVSDRTGEGQYLTATYGEQFKYEPRLGRLVGRDTLWLTNQEYDEYNYTWKMTLVAGTDTAAQVISKDRILDVMMTSTPNAGYYNYGLMLQIVHKVSGVTKQLNWNVKVLGVYAAGLLVADTKDGLTTDVSLIMSRSYNNDIENYEQDVVYYDIFSKSNDDIALEGDVSSMAYLSSGSDVEMLTLLIKGKSLLQVDPVTMKVIAKDMSLFYYEPAIFNPQEIFTAQWGSYSVLINDGILQFYETRYGMKYSFAPEFAYDLSTVYIPIVTNNCEAILFDKKGSKFVCFTGYGDNHVFDMPETTGGAFDPADMQGYEPIFGDLGNNSTARCLMKKEGKYYVCEIAGKTLSGTKVYDMSECIDLDKASSYAFSEAYSEFYYSVGDKLYVAILNTDTPGSRITFNKFGDNEVVTHILMHKGDGKTTWNEKPDGAPQWRDSENNLISVATYNSLTKEGKVYSLPIQYGGDGGIAADKYIHSYGKFGRITAIATK